MSAVYRIEEHKSFARARLAADLHTHWSADLEAGVPWTGIVEPIPFVLDFTRGKSFVLGDVIVSMHHGPLFSDRAIEALGLRGLEAAQWIPARFVEVTSESRNGSTREEPDAERQLVADPRRWFALHLETAIDALDYDETRCAGAAFGSAGLLLRLVFKHAAYPHLFHARHSPDLFVTKEFVDVCAREGVLGFRAVVAWDTTRGGRWIYPEAVINTSFDQHKSLRDALEDAKQQRASMRADPAAGLENAPDIAIQIAAFHGHFKQTGPDRAQSANHSANDQHERDEIDRHVARWSGSLRPYEAEYLRLALRRGTDIEPAPPIEIAPPGFRIGKCYTVAFSPSGRWLYVNRSNGAELWNVAARACVAKLKGLKNPGDVAFSPSEKRLCLQNSAGQVVAIDVPSGERVNAIRPSKLRLEGNPAFAPDDRHVLQMGIDGHVFVIDMDAGRVVLDHRLGPRLLGHSIAYVEGVESFAIVGGLVYDDPDYRDGGSRMWLWRWPVTENEPIQIGDRWESLAVGFSRDGRRAALHYRRARGAPDSDFVLDIVDTTNWTTLASFPCSGTICGDVSMLGDELTAMVRGRDEFFVLSERRARYRAPHHSRARASPAGELVALSGDTGVVVPVNRLGDLTPEFESDAVLRDLQQRGYTRRSTFPEKKWPPRVTVYFTDDRIVVESETLDGGTYIGVLPRVELSRTSSDDDLGRAVLQARVPRIEFRGAVTARSADDRRAVTVGSFHASVENVRRTVLVTFADDAWDVWGTTTSRSGQVSYDYWPVVALLPESSPDELGRVIRHLAGSSGKSIKK